jgi:hypothetical protein
MMIPRTLVPPGARLSAEDVTATTRRRPSTLDERTLVPSGMPNTKLETKSTIPSNLPLESIATRMVVPRDVNVELVQREDESRLPTQPSEMDERVTIPQGAVLPAEMPTHFEIPRDMVPPDIMSTGEVSLLTPDMGMRKSTEDQIKQALGMVAYLVVLALLVFEPQGTRRNWTAADDCVAPTGSAGRTEAVSTPRPARNSACRSESVEEGGATQN